MIRLSSPILQTVVLWLLFHVITAEKKKRIAVIGGGISGSFFTKYLTDHDVLHQQCILDSITVFDPFVVQNQDKDIFPKVSPQFYSSSDAETADRRSPSSEQQGSRVSSITLSDGTTVELGASILFSGNKLTVNMIENDHTLNMKEPFFTGSKKQYQGQHEDNVLSGLPKGMGIYDGDHSWSLITSNMTKKEVTKSMLWKYNFDLYRVDRATTRALDSFQQIYALLEDESTIFESPDMLWDKVGLLPLTKTSFDEHLNSIGVSKSVSWWKDYLASMLSIEKMGDIRKELLDSMNMCNNNKVNDQMTALAGLVNFVASKGDLFSVEDGNFRLIESALNQATIQEEQICGGKRIHHVSQRIQTVMSDVHEGSMELFGADNKSVGKFDYVVLAAPLQFAEINFLVRGSMFDNDVLHPMPLNGMVAENSDANDHQHRSAMGLHLPESTRRRYTQVVTTVVSNGKLNQSLFPSGYEMPRSILFTQEGKKEMKFSSITQLTRDGVFKMFTDDTIDNEVIKQLFGQSAKVEYFKKWGNSNGGATPDFNGGRGTSSTSAEFLLYDGGEDVGGDGTDSHALYYVNAIESAVSAIEISAIGAKAVSKLLAQRMGLIELSGEENDEL